MKVIYCFRMNDWVWVSGQWGYFYNGMFDFDFVYYLRLMLFWVKAFLVEGKHFQSSLVHPRIKKILKQIGVK